MCLGKAGSERICGEATLCFNQSGTGFKGSIQTQDQSMYIITGTKSRRRMQGNETTGDYMVETEQGLPIFFDIRVVDCDIGEEYNLKRVQGRTGEFCTFDCLCCSFTPEHVYRGQKADMMSQQLLGHALEGSHSNVSTGLITITCNPTTNNAHWVL
ncbi:unnamed protein product [Meganyctiphanes norvegica]|uniref:Uncharacterized protein n=1 Tax=Meganyctiphanes norvegica TaxID=48144 RepID=A0AAV2R313_MEGNR